MASTRCSSRWAWPAGWALLLFLLSARPGSDYPEISLPGLDKVVHTALYAPLGAGLMHALGRPVVAMALGALYGISDEWHQSFVPGRTPSAGDVAADTVGAALGVVAWGLRRRRRNAASAEGPPRDLPKGR